MNAINKPYLIDAVIGNSKLLASLGKNGRIYRMWWPHIDFPQHMDIIRNGLLIDGAVTWFDDEQAGWTYETSYMDRSNAVRIYARSNRCPLEVTMHLFAVPGQDVIVRHLSFHNNSDRPVQASYIHYSSFHISESRLYNTVMFDDELDALIHYRREYFFSVAGSNVCTSYQAGKNVWRSAEQGRLDGNSIDMAPDGALGWDLVIPANGMSDLTVYIAAGCSQREATEALLHARRAGYVQSAMLTSTYWQQYVSAATPCPIDDEHIRTLYERSLLVMKLMSDEHTGAVIAAPECDELFGRCGGYAYCWGRDAAFIATAMDRSGLTELSGSFYEWAIRAQSPDGSWQQRHYHDGRLAPSWGLQIDEGASILWGMWQHYTATRNERFTSDVWPSVRKGAEFLVGRLDPDTGLPLPSKDLWEERSAEHVYSAAAVYGGLTAAASFAELHQQVTLAERWRTLAERIREQIIARCWNESRSAYLRGLNLLVDQAAYIEAQREGKAGFVSKDAKGYETFYLVEDPIVDVSLLGLSVPFGLFPADDPRMARTADTIEALLTVPGVGGVKRYEDDPYIGGNPWILTTLWLCQFRIRQGRIEAAKSLLQWALDHQTELGLLPEQIDRETGAPAWVIPLTWSHAMFVHAVHMLADAEAASDDLQARHHSKH